MAFSTRRGRPRAPKSASRDLGTPELILKRAHSLTSEAIDLCLERGLVDERQHWCAVHLRWLYSLRHGTPGVRAIDPTHLGGKEQMEDDPAWRAEREKEYAEAIARLRSVRAETLLLGICVHNQRPGFLHGPVRFSTTPGNRRRLERQEAEIESFKTALDMLCTLWCRLRPVH